MVVMASGFVDEAQLHVRAGDRGAGAVSFRREAHVPRGGPDGGDGGKGGDVWLVADRNVASLLGFKDHPFRRATNGVHGQGGGRHGANGSDTRVSVPEGTTVKEKDGTVIADLVHEGDTWLAARGGRGGRGNARFLTNRRRAPSFAEQGEAGEERWLDMELRLIADVALVGLPNAGKSTLISRISAVTGAGVRPLVGRLAELVEEARAAEPVAESFVVHEPLAEGFHIEREPSGDFRVVGRPAERAVALSDITTPDAQDYLRHRLQRLGVDRALERAGAREGDTVHIGAMAFEYQPAGSTR